jgi:hypothetical protein
MCESESKPTLLRRDVFIRKLCVTHQ